VIIDQRTTVESEAVDDVAAAEGAARSAVTNLAWKVVPEAMETAFALPVKITVPPPVTSNG
jgi:hypothetical protein